jgi:manganese/zinc/iron transport system permease protein
MILAAWYPLLVPLCGVIIIGALSGLMGTFAFLQKKTMLGDVVAHAALPGIVGAFIVTQSSNLAVLLVGGFCAGLCAVMLITLISRFTPLPVDALFGIVLSVFFGMGLVLLTFVQKMALSSQSVLNKFLFGSAATLMLSDLYFLGALGVCLCGVVIIFWQPFILVIFDSEYARTLGMPVVFTRTLLQMLIVAVIVAGLYAVGVVLMSSLLVAPAVLARYVTRSVNSMALIAACWGIIACVVGMLISSSMAHMPTGALIVIVATLGAWCALFLRQGAQGIKI